MKREGNASSLPRGQLESPNTDLSEQSLIHAAEHNEAEWVRHHGFLPAVELHEDPDAVWLLSVHGLNKLVLPRFQDSAENRIEEIFSHYRLPGLGLSISAGPGATPENLNAIFKSRRLMGPRYLPALTLDLHAMNEKIPCEPGIRITDATDWALIARHGHPIDSLLPKKSRTKYYEALRFMEKLHPQRVFNFLALLEGKPVAASTLFLGAGSAGIYGVGTIEEARGKGIGSAVTVAALSFARDMGYRIGTLQTVRKARPMYERIGFSFVCNLTQWYYSMTRQAEERQRLGLPEQQPRAAATSERA